MTTSSAIIKADGTKEVFDPVRFEASLRKAGAGEHIAKRITDTISDTLVHDSTSKEIYARAFALLRREGRPIAARYALRRALLELGPTGHPFEDFISHLYRAEGWDVETRKLMKGKCVSHEIDFYASHIDKKEFLAAELKYHNDPGYKTDLKVALYVKSRFDDIFACDSSIRDCPIDRGILITNTKFTSEAISYAECSGVELLGWGYPVNDSLFIRMGRAKIYPITTVTGLSRTEKKILIEHNVVAVDEVMDDRRLLDPLRLSSERVGVLLAEIDGLLMIGARHDIVYP